VTLAADIRQVHAVGKAPVRASHQYRSGGGDKGSIQGIPYYLAGWNTVFIPTATTVKAEIRQFALALPAPTRPRTVSVVGEVNRPGSYVVVGGSATATATEHRCGVQEVGFLL